LELEVGFVGLDNLGVSLEIKKLYVKLDLLVFQCCLGKVKSKSEFLESNKYCIKLGHLDISGIGYCLGKVNSKYLTLETDVGFVRLDLLVYHRQYPILTESTSLD